MVYCLIVSFQIFFIFLFPCLFLSISVVKVMSKGEESGSSCEREELLKWNGWGFRDSYFYVDNNKDVTFTGEKYDISGKVMPNLRPWMVDNMGIDLDYTTPPMKNIPESIIPQSNTNDEFMDWMKQQTIQHSTNKHLRINRAHGHTCYDIMTLREGKCYKRIPDVVVWPQNQNEVVKIVEAADKMNACIIPIGGGTSVSSALQCPDNERRCIISLDMCKMNRLLWVDNKNLLARAEAGIIGRHLDEQLSSKGVTMGHEPDSIEFSSLGGWVATRASGMKKNKYGNIEDLVVHVTMVTPKGIMQKSCHVPRISAGPDIHHFLMGSEGTLGVITQVTFKIFPKPEVKKFGSILFPSFGQGVSCLREVAKQQCAPASIRLVDNEQFIFGQALKPAAESYWKILSDKVKKLYVTKWKGYKPDEMCAATLVFEGTAEEVEAHERRLYALAAKYSGLPAGADNGRYGYMLTYAIAYLRDLGFEYSCLGESFETSVPWDKVSDLCNNVKQLIKLEAKRLGVIYPVFASCRVTQIYDAGTCVYFYFGFNYRGMSNPLDIYHQIETAARDEIMSCGGSISHHHGIGKLRREWLPQTVGSVGLSAMQAVKSQLDPNNVFASANLFSVSKL